MNTKVKGFGAGVLAAVFYGTNPLGSLPLYADGITPGNVLFYRYGLAAVCFALWLLARGQSLKIGWGYAIKFAVLGSLFALSSITLYVSFKYMSAGIASTILFSYPIMTALLMVLFYHERLTLTTVASISLAVTGIGLLYHGGGDDGGYDARTDVVVAFCFLYRLCETVSRRHWPDEVYLLGSTLRLAYNHGLYDCCE